MLIDRDYMKSDIQRLLRPVRPARRFSAWSILCAFFVGAASGAGVLFFTIQHFT